MIALEPEAASQYYLHQPIQKGTENSTFGVFKSRAKYMFAGGTCIHNHFQTLLSDLTFKHQNFIDYMSWMIFIGGTMGITVHVVQENGTLKELHKANGGDWGGTKDDKSFISL